MRDDGGFTLLEMLIALAILALAVAGLTMTFSFANSTLRRTTGELEAIAALQSMRMTMADALGQTVTMRNTIAAYGDETSLTIYALGPRGLGTSRALKTTFRYDRTRQLLEALWESDAPDHTLVQHELLAGVEALSFSYLQASGDWSSRWEPGTSVQLVRVRADFADLPGRWDNVFAVRPVNAADCRNSKESPCRPLQ